MKRILLSSAILISLTACGVAQQAQLKSRTQEAQRIIGERCGLFLNLSKQEASAWLSTPIEQCSKGHSEPWDRRQTVAIGECGENIMKEYMRPVVSSKSKFDRLLEERNQEFQDYANGKISWQDFKSRGQKRVNSYIKHSKNGSYYALSQCHNTIMQEKVFPVYPNGLKPALTQYLADVSKYSRQADKNKVNKEDYMIGIEQLWANFVKNEQQKIDVYNYQNQQAWQNMSQKIMEIEAQDQQDFENSLPKQTNCNVWNNQVNCTTW